MFSVSAVDPMTGERSQVFTTREGQGKCITTMARSFIVQLLFFRGAVVVVRSRASEAVFFAEHAVKKIHDAVGGSLV